VHEVAQKLIDYILLAIWITIRTKVSAILKRFLLAIMSSLDNMTILSKSMQSTVITFIITHIA